MIVTAETFEKLVEHFREYRECNPTPRVLATMAIITLGVTVEQEDIDDQTDRERALENHWDSREHHTEM